MLSMLLASSLLLSGSAFAQDGTVTFPGAPGTGAPPERYTIQAGDTLWDIATSFMGNPSYWPRLWSLNDYITNPHWIYPGNTIVFRPGTLLEPPKVELEGQPNEGYQVRALTFEAGAPTCGPDVRFQKTIPSTLYSSPGFMSGEEDVEVWGEVFAAKTGSTLLGEGDLIYLNVEDPDALECGDIVTVFRAGRKVRHPDARNIKYGRIYKVVADARVVHREGDTIAAVVRESYREMKRGDLVGPAYPVRAEMAVEAPRGDLDGVIVARLDDDLYHLAGEGETVFLDRGRSDGLRVGNSFYIIERKDLNVGPYHYDERIPQQVVGRVVVTRVEESVATAVVVDSDQPVRVGAQLTMTVE